MTLYFFFLLLLLWLLLVAFFEKSNDEKKNSLRPSFPSGMHTFRCSQPIRFKVARYSFSESISFGKIATTAVLDEDENLL